MQELYTHVAPYTSSSVSVNMELTYMYGSDLVDREGPKVMSVTVSFVSVNRVDPKLT